MFVKIHGIFMGYSWDIHGWNSDHGMLIYLGNSYLQGGVPSEMFLGFYRTPMGHHLVLK